MTKLVRARGTPPWLALYALGLLCVVSFVFFGVLDLDGSEFELGPPRLSIKLAETSHEEFRRISLIGATPALVSAGVSSTEPRPASVRVLRRAPCAPPPVARVARAGLARARLADVPPSA